MPVPVIVQNRESLFVPEMPGIAVWVAVTVKGDGNVPDVALNLTGE
jgi:hypothetical protein